MILLIFVHFKLSTVLGSYVISVTRSLHLGLAIHDLDLVDNLLVGSFKLFNELSFKLYGLVHCFDNQTDIDLSVLGRENFINMQLGQLAKLISIKLHHLP